MRDGDRHVVPSPGGGWDVKSENAKRASSHHETQAEAIERAREIIRNKGGGELTVHGEDGQIREKDTVAASAVSTGAAKAPTRSRSAAKTTARGGAVAKAPTRSQGPAKAPARSQSPAKAPARSQSAANETPSGGPAAGPDEPDGTSRATGGGLAETGRPVPAAAAPRPSFGARLKGWFGRSRG